ncbi:MAG: hypothetical protein M1834_004847 [Cirrosporium novae-zelandiae]|nr:MAG: hypothetical protein M1834_004847 [Cirrosporium novae-zelandiae]
MAEPLGIYELVMSHSPSIDFDLTDVFNIDPTLKSTIPYFVYIEHSEDGSCCFSSTGNGIFEKADNGSTQPAFSVEKTRSPDNLIVRIQSGDLRKLLCEALQRECLPDPLDLRTLFLYYTILKLFLQKKEQLDQPIRELRLFVRDFLLDRVIFKSFGFEDLFEQGILSISHWHDMQRWSTERHLDAFDRIFESVRFHCERPSLDIHPNGRDPMIDWMRLLIQRGCIPAGSDRSKLKRKNQRCKKRIRLEEAQAQAQSQRETLGINLWLSLQRNLSNLQERSHEPSASSNFLQFGKRLIDPRYVWKRGTQVIRRLLRNILPHNVEEVYCCLLVAKAMSDATLEDRYEYDYDNDYNCDYDDEDYYDDENDYDDDEDDYDDEDNWETIRKVFCNENQFLDDLDRWRLIVEKGHQPLYDEIAMALWKKTPREDSPYCPTNNIHHLQELLRGVISSDIAVAVPWGHSNQSPPTYRGHGETSSYSLIDNQYAPWNTSRPYNAGIENIDPNVVMLAGTAVFGAIIAFLLLFCHMSAPSSTAWDFDVAFEQAKTILKTFDHHELMWAWIVARNCILLACYIGLQTSTINRFPLDLGLKSWGDTTYWSRDQHLCPNEVDGNLYTQPSPPQNPSPSSDHTQRTPTISGSSFGQMPPHCRIYKIDQLNQNNGSSSALLCERRGERLLRNTPPAQSTLENAARCYYYPSTTNAIERTKGWVFGIAIVIAMFEDRVEGVEEMGFYFLYGIYRFAEYDNPSYILQAFIPPSAHDAYLSIRAFNVSLALVADNVSASSIGIMRMQFWRDTITKTFAGTPPKEPVALLLAHALDDLSHRSDNSAKMSKHWFMRVIEAREKYLNNAPYADMEALEKYAENTYSTLMYLTLAAIPMTSLTMDHLASHIGKAAGIVAVLRGLPLIAFPSPPKHQSNTAGLGGMLGGGRQGAIVLPLDIMAEAGVKEEEVFRKGADAPGLRDAVFEVATRASDHLITARLMLKNLEAGEDVGHDFEHQGEEGHDYTQPASGVQPQQDLERGFGVLMPAVPTALWLDRLQNEGFDIFKQDLRIRDWKLPWKAYFAFKRRKI